MNGALKVFPFGGQELAMIMCCGEALIDFLPTQTRDGALAFQPFNGGSVYNVAIALGRLGCDVGYFGGLSRDFFGQLLADELKASDVDISAAPVSDRPTTLAFVNFNNGQPEYVFLDENSAGRMLDTRHLSNLPDEIGALHFGSISLINDPAASAYEKLARQHFEKQIISIDPNIRPSLISDPASYRARLTRMVTLADIVKISDEDLAWLEPNNSIEDCARRWIDQGVKLVVITKGSDGAVGFTKSFKIECPIEPVKITDTIGAGDTFMAGLLAFLDKQELLESAAILKIDKATLLASLKFAGHAAAITVSRAGANPPWQHEL